MAEYKLDIFKTLSAIDRKDYSFLECQSTEAQKGFAPPVVMRWTSAVTDGGLSEYYIWLTNENANIHFWDLYEHPNLQYKLLATCGAGKNQRHMWIPNAKTSKKNNALFNFLRSVYPYANDFELSVLLKKYEKSEFIQLVDLSGLMPEEIKEIKAEYGKFNKEK